MGSSHARAYHEIDGFRVTGVVSRGSASRTALAAELGVPAYDSFEQGIAAGGVQVVSVNTHPDSHYRYAMAALQAGCHLFVEKPLATTVAEVQEIVATARARGRKVVVGYVLRHHPSWRAFIDRPPAGHGFAGRNRPRTKQVTDERLEIELAPAADGDAELTREGLELRSAEMSSAAQK